MEIAGDTRRTCTFNYILIDQEEVLIAPSIRNSLVGGGVGINTYIEVPEKYKFLKKKNVHML